MVFFIQQDSGYSTVLRQFFRPRQRKGCGAIDKEYSGPRLPCPEHLNLRFVRIPVDAFRLHDELLTPVKRKRPLVFLIDAQRQVRFARLCILQQRFANALGTRGFCNENPLDVVLRQTDEAVDLPGASFSWT